MRRFRFDDDVTFGMAIVQLLLLGAVVTAHLCRLLLKLPTTCQQQVVMRLLLLCCTLIGMVLGALLVA